MFDPYRFGVSRFTTQLPKLKTNIRIAQLSDLHIGFFLRTGSVRKWVELTLEQNPDLIVITGDTIDSAKPSQTLETLKELAKLKAPLGVYLVWGNHDYRFNNYRSRDMSKLQGILKSHGIELLNNRGVLLREDFFLSGVDDLWEGFPDVHAAIADKPEHAECVLLCHNPDYFFKVPKEVGLTLSGHTHGGQVVAPLYGPVFTSSAYGQRFASGWTDDPVKGFVSRGLGLSSIPIRILCPAELVVHDLVPLMEQK